jgi:hypothetical protein
MKKLRQVKTLFVRKHKDYFKAAEELQKRLDDKKVPVSVKKAKTDEFLTKHR